MSDMLAAHFVKQPRTLFSCFTATAHFWSWSPLCILDPTGLLPNNLPAGQCPLYIGVCNSSFPHARHFISSWWSSSAFHQSISPAFWCCSGWQHNPPEHQPLLPFLCHQQTCCTIVWLINGHAEQDWTQYCPMQCTGSHWPPARLCATEHHPLGLAIQAVFSPIHCLPI